MVPLRTSTHTVYSLDQDTTIHQHQYSISTIHVNNNQGFLPCGVCATYCQCTTHRVRRYLVFARDALLSSPALPQLFGWGAATLMLRERESVAQVGAHA